MEAFESDIFDDSFYTYYSGVNSIFINKRKGWDIPKNGGWILPTVVPPTAFIDEFSGESVNQRWTIINPTANSTITQTDGVLRFVTNNICDWWDSVSTSPISLAKTPDGDWTIETKIGTLTADNTYFCGLVLYNSRANALRFGKAYGFGVTGSDTTLGYWKNWSGNAEYPNYYKIQKEGTTYTFYYSTNGTSWTQYNQLTLGTYNKIGLCTQTWIGHNTSIDFDYFKITKN